MQLLGVIQQMQQQMQQLMQQQQGARQNAGSEMNAEYCQDPYPVNSRAKCAAILLASVCCCHLVLVSSPMHCCTSLSQLVSKKKIREHGAMSENGRGGSAQKRFTGDSTSGAAEDRVWKRWARAAVVVSLSLSSREVSWSVRLTAL